MKIELQKTNKVWVAVLQGLIVFTFCLWGIEYSVGEHTVFKYMLLVPAYLFLAAFIYILIGMCNMSYRLTERGFVITWGVQNIQVPWEEVNHIIHVQGESNLFPIIGANWPGYKVGLFNARGLGPVRMYATCPEKGFIYLKTSKGFFGLTPQNDKIDDMIVELSSRTGKEIEVINMEKIPIEIKGENAKQDRFYSMLMYINIVFLLIFAIYLGIFFPGSGAPRILVLLLVLAVSIFFFNTGNANRLYQFSSTGGYVMLALGILVTGIFLILSLGEISL